MYVMMYVIHVMMCVDVCCLDEQEMLDEVTSRRQAAVTLTFQVEQLLKHSSSDLTAEQTTELETLKDDVRHRLNTVRTCLFLFLPSTSSCIHKTRCQLIIHRVLIKRAHFVFTQKSDMCQLIFIIFGRCTLWESCKKDFYK